MSRGGWTKEERRTYFNALNDGSQASSPAKECPSSWHKFASRQSPRSPTRRRRELADLLKAGREPAEPLPPARPLVKQLDGRRFRGAIGDSRAAAGTPDKGAIVFRDALCVRCHRAGARGPAVGPDLTHVSGRFSRRDLLDSILTPQQGRRRELSQRAGPHDRRAVRSSVACWSKVISAPRNSACPRSRWRPAEVVEIDKQQIDEVRESETVADADRLDRRVRCPGRARSAGVLDARRSMTLTQRREANRQEEGDLLTAVGAE